MLKLLKYNFKSFLFNHLALIIALFVNAIVLKTLGYLSAQVNLPSQMFLFIETLKTIFNGLFYISLIMLPLMTFIMTIARYRKKVLGDEAYLTHTLPLSKHAIITSGTLNTIIYLFIDLFVIFTALSIVVGPATIKTYYQLFVGNNNVIASLLLLVLLFIGFIVVSHQFILAFTLGYSHETNKVRNSIIYGILIYLVNQFIMGLYIGFAFVFAFRLAISRMDLFILSLGIVVYIGIFMGTYSIINYSLKKKLNLE